MVAWVVISLSGCSSIRPFGTDRVDGPIDVAIVTVLPQEYHAVVRKLDNVHPVLEQEGRTNPYAWVTGEVRTSHREVPRRVVVAMVGEAGEVSGALATKTTIDRWRPRDVLLVGIAGGIHPSVSPGDVVVSSQIWGYEHGHLGIRYDSAGRLFFQPDPELLEAARSLDPGWRRRIEIPAPEPGGSPEVLFGETASGDKVIENASSAYFAQSLRLDSSTLAIEMEGAGASAAMGSDHDMGGTTGFLMIRGISDVVREGDPKEGALPVRGRNPQRDEWKDYAADVAASFAVELIAVGGSREAIESSRWGSEER
jgi:nucleoside phosphorylase